MTNTKNKTIWMVIDCRSVCVCVFDSEEKAIEKAAKFNSEPTIDGEPDTGLPYSVEGWHVN